MTRCQNNMTKQSIIQMYLSCDVSVRQQYNLFITPSVTSRHCPDMTWVVLEGSLNLINWNLCWLKCGLDFKMLKYYRIFLIGIYQNINKHHVRNITLHGTYVNVYFSKWLFLRTILKGRKQKSWRHGGSYKMSWRVWCEQNNLISSLEECILFSCLEHLRDYHIFHPAGRRNMLISVSYFNHQTSSKIHKTPKAVS